MTPLVCTLVRAGWFARAGRQGGFKRGGFPMWTCPFFLFVLFGIFPIFAGVSLFFRGISRLVLCLSRPTCLIKTTYEEQFQKGSQHNQDLSQKKWQPTPFGNPPAYFLSRSCSQILLPDSFFVGKKVPGKNPPGKSHWKSLLWHTCL